MPKIKFFAWLLLNDGLNTRNLLRRRSKYLDQGYNYVLCHENVEETASHLFFDCSTAITRWFSIGIIWDDSLDINQKIENKKAKFGSPLSIEIFMVAAWCIWKEIYSLIFDGKIPSVSL